MYDNVDIVEIYSVVEFDFVYEMRKFGDSLKWEEVFEVSFANWVAMKMIYYYYTYFSKLHDINYEIWMS